MKTPCPWCKTNKHIVFPNKTGYKNGDARSIAGFRSRIPIVAAIGKCTNKECSGNTLDARRPGDSTDYVKDHTFTLYDHACWSLYPRKLRERYQQYLYTIAATGNDGEILVTQDLCLEVLKDEVNFSSVSST